MKHLGDIRRINGGGIEAVDCITFGSPCQDLSAAGKRAGLAGKRSGLFGEAVRIIREMRETSNGIYPAFAVWENVPGAFSSNKGEDFREVLGQLSQLKEPGIVIPRPEKGKWKPAGYVLGDGWSIAWRTMDAQYWGVPQRRRRIALVMDFGGQRAGEILFERQGMPGDFETGGKTGETSAGDTAAGSSEHDRWTGGQETCLTPWDVQSQRIYSSERKGPSLCSGGDSGHKYGYVMIEPVTGESAGFSAGQGSRAEGIGYQAECSPALKSSDSGTNRTPCVVYDARGNGTGYLCPTITGEHQNRITDYTAICIQGNCIDRADTVRCNGKGWKENISFTLNTVDRPGVMCMAGSQEHAEITYEKTCTLTCKREIPLLYSGKSPIVRRLTPLECERLQGYPDGWTDIGAWTDTKGKQHRTCSDTARYRALGNSIALPQWRWLFSRMAEYLPERAKLGSLFDGIGGFPLCWEDIQGKGTARWASEIEEFPVAVTKYHFGEG